MTQALANSPARFKATSEEIQKRERQIADLLCLETTQARNITDAIHNQGPLWIKEAVSAKSLVSKQVAVLTRNGSIKNIDIQVLPDCNLLIRINELYAQRTKWVDRAFVYLTGEVIVHARGQSAHTDLFLKEMKITEQFKEVQGVVRMLSKTYEKEKGIHGMTLQHYAKGNLASEIEQGSFILMAGEYQRKIRNAITLMNGLSQIHARGLVHNDIRPEKILVGQQMAIGDLSLMCQPGPECFTGTPEYFSPEMLHIASLLSLSTVECETANKLKLLLGPHKDVWAMGITLFLYFFPPLHSYPYPPCISDKEYDAEHGSITQETYESFEKQYHQFIKQLEELKKQVPTQVPFIELIKKMLAFSTTDRITSAEALLSLQSIAKSF